LGDFEDALKWRPDDPEAFIARATCLRKLGRFSEAIDDYNAARCLLQPELFAGYKKRHRIKALTSEKVIRISRRMTEDSFLPVAGSAGFGGDAQGGFRGDAQGGFRGGARAGSEVSGVEVDEEDEDDDEAATALATIAAPLTPTVTAIASSEGILENGSGSGQRAKRAIPLPKREVLSLLARGFGTSSDFHVLASHFKELAVSKRIIHSHTKIQRFAAGEVLLSPLKPLTHAFLILSGSVHVSCAGPNDQSEQYDAGNPPPFELLEMHGYRHVEWVRRGGFDNSIELSAKLMGGDCVGGLGMLKAVELRARLADGHEEPPTRTQPSGLSVVARKPTVCVLISLGSVERLFLKARRAECALICSQLADMQLFKEYTSEALLRLARHMNSQTYGRGDVIITQGSPVGDTCFIHAGQCRVTRVVERSDSNNQPPRHARSDCQTRALASSAGVGEKGRMAATGDLSARGPPRTVELGTLWALEWFGELSVVDPSATRANVTVTAETIVTVYTLPVRQRHELNPVLETMRADFRERYPADRVLLARSAQQRNWTSFKAKVVGDVLKQRDVRR